MHKKPIRYTPQNRCKPVGVKQGKNPPEVTFSLEPRHPNPGQLEGGERLFGKLAARAWASLTAARGAPNQGPEHSDQEDRRGRRRQPPAPPRPPSLTNRGVANTIE